jgi:pilus assembly protein Flp/PilA
MQLWYAIDRRLPAAQQVMQTGVKTVNKKIMQFVRNEEGLTTVEYAIAGGLVGAAVIVAFTELGAAVGVVITEITTALTA